MNKRTFEEIEASKAELKKLRDWTVANSHHSTIKMKPAQILDMLDLITQLLDEIKDLNKIEVKDEH